MRARAAVLWQYASTMDAQAAPHPAATAISSPAERRKLGAALRRHVPRSAHGEWTPPPDRPDPVAILIRQGESRVQDLLPIRYERMRADPRSPSCAAPPRSWPPTSPPRPTSRHDGAGLRRLPSGQFRRLRLARGHAGLRRQRLRRDAAGAVRVGPQAARHQLRPRRPRRGTAAKACRHLARTAAPRLSRAHGRARRGSTAAGAPGARASTSPRPSPTSTTQAARARWSGALPRS